MPSYDMQTHMSSASNKVFVDIERISYTKILSTDLSGSTVFAQAQIIM